MRCKHGAYDCRAPAGVVEPTHMLWMLDADPAMQQRQTLTPAISATIEWLAGDECHALDEAALADGLGRRLRSAGLPLDHLGLYLRTLHPEILGHTVGWVPDEPARVYRRPHDFVRTNGYFDNPIVRVLETQTPVVLRVDPQRDASWSQNDLFKGRPLVELVVLPLRTSDALPSGVPLRRRAAPASPPSSARPSAASRRRCGMPASFATCDRWS
jgi:hypothetical protein